MRWMEGRGDGFMVQGVVCLCVAFLMLKGRVPDFF